MNIVLLRALGGLGGGGDVIKSLNPIFYIKDLTQVVSGYFVDSSGNNKQIQAATTTVTNDSLILPANDTEIIAAVTAAGCYSQYYTNNSTPKTVLLSNISPCYNDYSYYNYFDKKNFTLFSASQATARAKLLELNNIYILAVRSVQTGTAAQVSGTYQCISGKNAAIDYGNWGNQNIQVITPTGTDNVLASTGYLANTTYQIQLFSRLAENGISKITWNAQLSIAGSISLVDLPRTLTQFTIVSLLNLTITGVISNLPPALTMLYWNNLPNLSVTGTVVSLPQTLTFLYLNNNPGLALTGTIDQFPASISSTLLLQSLTASSITYTGGVIPAWGTVTITIQTGLTETMLRNFIINWASVAGIGAKTVNLGGSNASIHVNQTDDPTLYNAVQTLQSVKLKTLIYNNY